MARVTREVHAAGHLAKCSCGWRQIVSTLNAYQDVRHDHLLDVHGYEAGVKQATNARAVYRKRNP